MMDFPRFDPPGEMIDIGTQSLHTLTMGEGDPLVLLDTGSGDNLLTWAGIQSEIATFSRVIAYDRPGLGWSERGNVPYSLELIVDTLYQLITRLELPTPLILVGHSIGGINVRQFTYRFPELVAGLVLIDGSHEGQDARQPEGDDPDAEILEMIRGLSTKTFEDVLSHFIAEPRNFFEMPEEQQCMLERHRPEYLKYLVEAKDCDTGLVSLGDDALQSLGNIPLTVLTATSTEASPEMDESDKAFKKIFQQCQTEISQLSTQGKQIFVEDATHYIHRQQPQQVVDAIREMVTLVQKQ